MWTDRARPALLVAACLVLPATAGAAEAAKDPEPGSPEAIELAIRLIDEAQNHLDEGYLARALQLALRVAVLAPGAPGAHDFLGDLYMTTGDCARALHHYEAFLRLGGGKKRRAKAQKRAKKCATSDGVRGKLVLEVVPDGAAVRVLPPYGAAPIAAGHGSLKVTLPSGTYRVQASLPGHVSLDVEVRVHAGESTKVVESLPPRPATLTVRSRPTGASVQVDGEPTGRAPVTIDPMEPGDHEVVVMLAGHEPARTRVRVRPGQVVSLELAPEAIPARLRVISDAPDTRISLDGSPRCTAPCEVSVPAGGKHVLAAAAPGFLTVSEVVTPEPDQRGEVRLTLTPTPELVAARSRRSWGSVLAVTGGVLLAGGLWVLARSLDSAVDADTSYARYLEASDTATAMAAYDEAGSLDGRAATELSVAGGMLAAGSGALVLGGWGWLTGAQ